MPQATSDQVREFWALPESAPAECHTILQNQTLYENALAMSLTTGASAGKAQPYVSGTANSQILGWCRNSYQASSGADLVLPNDSPALFKRGVAACAGKAGNLPTEAQLNVPGGVAFDDSSGTVKATVAANDGTGTLRAIKDGFFYVEI